MLINLFKKSCKRSVPALRHDYFHLEKVSVEENGILVQKLQMTNFDFSQKNSQFVYTDFDLGNVIASGATNLLRPVQFQGVNVDSVISDTLKALNYAEKLNSQE